MKYKVGDNIRILNAKKLECDGYWKDGTIVEVFSIDEVYLTLNVYKYEGESYKTHEIYFNEYKYIELVESSSEKEIHNQPNKKHRKLDELDIMLQDLRKDYLLDNKRFDDLRELVEELNKGGEFNE